MRALAILPLALAACAAPRSEAPAPAAAPAPLVAASLQPDGTIRVTGPAAGDDDFAAHHCRAAKLARVQGAETMEYIVGVTREKAIGVDAVLAYETGAPATPVDKEEVENGPAGFGAAPLGAWFSYCDEAGIPREGEA